MRIISRQLNIKSSPRNEEKVITSLVRVVSQVIEKRKAIRKIRAKPKPIILTLRLFSFGNLEAAMEINKTLSIPRMISMAQRDRKPKINGRYSYILQTYFNSEPRMCISNLVIDIKK